jgi:hypothetical protein
MSHLVEFSLDAEGQTKVLVEISAPAPSQGQARVGLGGTVVVRANEAFDAAVAGIKPIAETIMAQLTNLLKNADEISVEFGVKLSANAGVILAGTSAEGNCKISIKWTPKS